MIPRTGRGAYVALCSAVIMVCAAGLGAISLVALLLGKVPTLFWVALLKMAFVVVSVTLVSYGVGVWVEERRLSKAKAAAGAAAHSRRE